LVKSVRQWLQDESQDKYKVDFPWEKDGWKVVSSDDCPCQDNDVDCGVFVIKMAHYLTLKRRLDFKQGDMPCFR